MNKHRKSDGGPGKYSEGGCENDRNTPDEEVVAVGHESTESWVHKKLETQRCDGDYSFPLRDEGFPANYLEYRKLLHEKEQLTRRHKIKQGREHEVKKAEEYTRNDFLDQFYETFSQLRTRRSNAEFGKFYEAFKQTKIEQLRQWEAEESQLPLRDGGVESIDLQLQEVESKLEEMKKLFEGEISRCSLDPTLNGGDNWLLVPGFRAEDLPVCGKLEDQIRSNDKTVLKYEDSPLKKLNDCSAEAILYPALYFSALDQSALKHIVWHQIQVLLALHDGILPFTEIEKLHKDVFGYEILDLIKNGWDSVFPTLLKSIEDLITEKLRIEPGLGIQICRVTLRFDPDTDSFTQEKYLIQKPSGTEPMSDKMRAIVEDKLNVNSLAITSPQSQSSLTMPPSTPGNQIMNFGIGVVAESQTLESAEEFDPEEMARRKQAEQIAQQLILKLGHVIPVIPWTYVQPGEPPNTVSYCIQEGEYVRGMIFDPVNPCKMFVILTQFWDELELYQREIQQRMNTIVLNFESRKDSSIPDVSVLEPGLFIMVYCTCGEEEWFRARVRFVESTEPLVIHVQLADFGCFEVITDIKNIRFMRRDIFRDFQQQMIECKLHFSKKFCTDELYPVWDPEMDFRSFAVNRPMGIHFRNKVHFKNPDDSKSWNNEIVWIVTMNLLCKGKTSRSDHTKQQELTDMYNPYLESEIGMELERRSRSSRKKRYFPVGQGQPMNPAEAQDIFEMEMQNIHEHGEFLCKVEVYDISNVVLKYIVDVPKPPRVPTPRAIGRGTGTSASFQPQIQTLSSATSRLDINESEGSSVAESRQQQMSTSAVSSRAEKMKAPVTKLPRAKRRGTRTRAAAANVDKITAPFPVPGISSRGRTVPEPRRGSGHGRGRQDSDSDHAFIAAPGDDVETDSDNSVSFSQRSSADTEDEADVSNAETMPPSQDPPNYRHRDVDVHILPGHGHAQTLVRRERTPKRKN